MKMDNGYERRSLRVNGEQPTARDRWKSFHRLWRMAGKYEMSKRSVPNFTQTAFYCLGGRDVTRWVQLMGKEDRLAGRHLCPPFLRRILLDSDRRRRIHGDYRQDWWERNKVVAAQVSNEKGIEVTPDEVAEVRAKLVNYVRSKARVDGIHGLPRDDEALLCWLNKGRG